MSNHNNHKGTWFQRFCLRVLTLFGWRHVFVPQPEAKGVILVYPHTSNWDFMVGIFFRYGCGLRTHWLAKHSAFWWPLGPILRFMGGIPIDRRHPQGTIGAIAEEFHSRDWMWIAITPEGTRAHTDHWKSGFYRIALEADVPCGMGCIDYRTKTVSIDTYLRFTGDEETDLAMIRDYYGDKQALYPENEGEIRFPRQTVVDDKPG
jgi:1-acyl-sn-glycerol-3-phosphate acyltransferase